MRTVSKGKLILHNMEKEWRRGKASINQLHMKDLFQLTHKLIFAIKRERGRTNLSKGAQGSGESRGGWVGTTAARLGPSAA